jgi:chloride channel 3/4/5
MLAAAAAAGVSVAFGSPLGGVLFGLEGMSSARECPRGFDPLLELDTFSDEHVVWRAFVTSVIAAVALQYVDPFGTSKLVLFQVFSDHTYLSYELSDVR